MKSAVEILDELQNLAIGDSNLRERLLKTRQILWRNSAGCAGNWDMNSILWTLFSQEMSSTQQ